MGTAYIETDHGVTASVGNPTAPRLMRLAAECVREALRIEGREAAGRGPEDPDQYLRDYLETTADGLAEEAARVEVRRG